MTASKLRAAMTAAFLGTATVGAAAVLLAAPVQAASVRAVVGTPLKAAQDLAAAGNYKAAMAKVDQANAVPNKTPDETKIIAQMKEYIGAKSGDVSIGGAAAAKTKFAQDYNARKYTDVIADGDLLKKTNALDAASMQVVAQAYYLSGNKKGCIDYIQKTMHAAGGDATQELLMRCAYDAGDTDTQRGALETLVAHTGKAEYWSDLLKLSEHGAGMSDHDTLDIYRLKLLTGTIQGKDEYTLLAQLSVQLGFPAEAVAVIEKGQAANVMNDDRSKRLLALAKTQAATDEANTAKNLAAANASPTGDALIKVGEDFWGQGKAQDAISAIQAGLKKKLTDKDNAQIRLGMAYLGAHQKAEAVKTFASVKGPDSNKTAMLAHLWSLYAQQQK